MLAEAKAKPRRRRNEVACGAPVARFEVWVGLFHSSDQTRFQQTGGPRVTYVYGRAPLYEGIPNAAYRQKEVLMPLQSEPAQETQIDWHEVRL